MVAALTSNLPLLVRFLRALSPVLNTILKGTPAKSWGLNEETFLLARGARGKNLYKVIKKKRTKERKKSPDLSFTEVEVSKHKPSKVPYSVSDS